MKIIAVVNLKGGVGKTTTSILIATQLAALGHTVTVLDMDIQGSATDWARIADEDATPLPFEVRPGNHASLRSFKPTADFTIIDTPPADPTVVDAAVKASDLVIVPTSPGFMDTDRAWSTVEVAATKVPTYVLLSRFDGRTNDAADFAAALDERGVARFETIIPASVHIGRLRGSVAQPSKFGFDNLTTELLEVL